MWSIASMKHSVDFSLILCFLVFFTKWLSHTEWKNFHSISQRNWSVAPKLSIFFRDRQTNRSIVVYTKLDFTKIPFSGGPASFFNLYIDSFSKMQFFHQFIFMLFFLIYFPPDMVVVSWIFPQRHRMGTLQKVMLQRSQKSWWQWTRYANCQGNKINFQRNISTIYVEVIVL